MSATSLVKRPSLATAKWKPSALQDKFALARMEMDACLIERGDEIDLALTALLCGEHFLMVGEPGTAKSMLLDAVIDWCGQHATKFSNLMNKFSTPEEIYGPISLQGMKKDDYRRVIVGMLPSAHFAFLDEIFKSSSAVLNTMLKILNERTYRNGSTGVLKCPLKLCVAASNEWPGGEGQETLGALFDRFLIRKTVKPISSADGLDRLLWSESLTPTFSDHLTNEELDEAQAEAKSMPWSDDAKKGLLEVFSMLRAKGVIPGDRRKRKAIGIVNAYAWLQGSDKVKPEHLMVLCHVLWNDPVDQPEKVYSVIAQISNPVLYQVNARLVEAQNLVNACNAADWGEAATAVSKLGEILKTIRAMKDHPTVESAIDQVEGMIHRLKSVHMAKASD